MVVDRDEVNSMERTTSSVAIVKNPTQRIQMLDETKK